MVRIIQKGLEWEKSKGKIDALIKTNWKGAELIQLASQNCVWEMQSRCPVRTGWLRQNIYMVERGDGAEIYSDASYSGFVEYGTRFMKAQPFFRPALANMYKALWKRYKTLIWQVEDWKGFSGIPMTPSFRRTMRKRRSGI
jgi:HK97 gp10 family phage protein